MGLFTGTWKKSIGLSDGVQRRRHERHGTDVVNCELGELVDLSRSGMRIATKGKPPLRLHQTAMVTLKFTGRKVKVAVQARWIKRAGLRSYHVGLMFVNLPEKTAGVIESVAKYGFICDDPNPPQPKARKQTQKPVKAEIELPDYYRLLEIQKDAADEDVHAAYRRLAQVYHPDVNKSPDAEAKFIQIKEAYEILRDPKQRESYDRQAAA